ncbi:MAG: RNA polymerase sigma factor [bacterium]
MDSGPPNSFDDWLRGARPRLLWLAVSRLKDRIEAEDVVQDTALAVWKRHAAGAVDKLDAYANRAVWLNAVRRAGRRRVFEELETAEFGGFAEVLPEVEGWLESLELEAHIARLPAAQAAVVRLRFYAGLSFSEMAESLSIGINTAASRTRYALAALKKALERSGSGSDVPEKMPPKNSKSTSPHQGNRLKEKNHEKRHGR